MGMCYLNYGTGPGLIASPADATASQQAAYALLRIQDRWSCSCHQDADQQDKAQEVADVVRGQASLADDELAQLEAFAARVIAQRAFWDDRQDGSLEDDLAAAAGLR